MRRAENSAENKRDSFLVALIRSSLILTALDNFTAYIYKLLREGFFGRLFTRYNANAHSLFFEKLKTSKAAVHFTEFRYGICRRMEESVVIAGVSYIMRYLLGCRLRVYGVFMASFGFYTAVILFIKAAVANNITGITSDPYTFYAVLLMVSSIPLVASKKNLSEALRTSVIGSFVMKITGFSEEEASITEGNGGHINTAFLAGIVFGVMTYYLSPLTIAVILASAVGGYLILIRPELGVLALFFLTPWLPTMLLAALLIFTFFCYLIKLFRGKRLLKIEALDIAALAFACLTLFGGLISLSSASAKPSLLMFCLSGGYFITVFLITSRRWLVKCSCAAVASAVLESLYSLMLYFTGGGYSSKAWLDSEMFGNLGGRAVGTLDNPNMLGEYLIMIIPIAAAMLVGQGEGMKRFPAFLSCAVMGACLVLTWSRGAWIGLMFGLVVFMFMWHRRSLWIVFAGIISLPILPSILPASIVNRFMSIGNLSDSSTSYRVYIWRSSVAMIKDNLFSGIGVGQGAWNRVYPTYAYMGVEAAPHSHNLYLQILLEIGIFGLLAFAAFIVLLYSSGFTLFSELSSPLSGADLTGFCTSSDEQDAERGRRRAKIQLRVSAAGPLCGIAAVLLQGLTDYTWYNYRVFLMFWLIAGLASAYIRNGRKMLDDTSPHFEDSPEDSSVWIGLSENSSKNRHGERKRK